MTEMLYVIEVEPNVFLRSEYIDNGETILHRERKPYRADLFEKEAEAMRLIVDIEENLSGMSYINSDRFSKFIVKSVSFIVHDSSIE